MKKNQRQDLNDDKAAGTPGVVLGTKSKRLCTSLVVTLAVAHLATTSTPKGSLPITPSSPPVGLRPPTFHDSEPWLQNVKVVGGWGGRTFLCQR